MAAPAAKPPADANLCFLALPKAAADDWNRETIITFSGPVEVPGVGTQILPAHLPNAALQQHANGWETIPSDLSCSSAQF
jgi:hypothetical protein